MKGNVPVHAKEEVRHGGAVRTQASLQRVELLLLLLSRCLVLLDVMAAWKVATTAVLRHLMEAAVVLAGRGFACVVFTGSGLFRLQFTQKSGRQKFAAVLAQV
jgi:hypothetical protein